MVKSSDAEEEYFKREELAKQRRMREQQTSEMAEQEKRRLKELHWMHCPKCGLQLSEVEFRGVNVDVCYGCGGMYLDQGEVDKITEYKEPGVLKQISSTIFGR